ncbi:sigma-E factor negative regulatory protein [Pseudoxanthomonas daejeonensis]
MSQEPSIPTDANVDKLELHTRQQLSALVDGELSPDEARFLLRRLQHDTELSGRFERWQLGGDVLRGQVKRVAAADLSERIAAAIAGDTAAGHGVQPAAAAGGRAPVWTRWGGGGAALAASVAVVAMLVGRPAAPDQAAAPIPALAMQTLPSTEARLPAAPVAPALPQREVAAVAPPARQQPRPVNRVRPSPAIATESTTAVADAGGASALPADPFASAAPLQARPWPRADLAQPSSGRFTASLGESPVARPFYPFEPSPPVEAAAPVPADDQELPAPPEDDGR